jgi:hypothetical protein
MYNDKIYHTAATTTLCVRAPLLIEHISSDIYIYIYIYIGRDDASTDNTHVLKNDSYTGFETKASEIPCSSNTTNRNA